MVSGNKKVTGKIEQPDIITGQLCARHVLKQHDDGKPPWCHYCGKDANGDRQGKPNGGWA